MSSEQDFAHAKLRTGDGGNGGRGGDIGAHNVITNNVSVTQFVVNSDGKALNLDMDGGKNLVTSSPFDGSYNQQWLFQDHGNGKVALRSMYNAEYVALGGKNQGAAVVAATDPFTWKALKDDKGGYKLAVPNSDLALSLGNSAILRPISHEGTRLFILENTPENEEAIKNGKIDPSAPTTASAQTEEFKAAGTVNITFIINDLSGSGNATDALNDLRNLFSKSDGIRNLVICLGHHQIMESFAPTPIASPSVSRVNSPTRETASCDLGEEKAAVKRSKKIVLSQTIPAAEKIKILQDRAPTKQRPPCRMCDARVR